MDDLIIELIKKFFHWVKQKSKFLLYNHRGKKNLSFVDYGIALCYENDYNAVINRTKEGLGEVFINVEETIYHIFSNEDKIFFIELMDAFCIENGYWEFAKELQDKPSKEFLYKEHRNEDDNILIDICCKIDVDAKLNNARLYINGYIQDVLAKEQERITKEYILYRKNNPKQEVY